VASLLFRGKRREFRGPDEPPPPPPPKKKKNITKQTKQKNKKQKTKKQKTTNKSFMIQTLFDQPTLIMAAIFQTSGPPWCTAFVSAAAQSCPQDP